MRSIYLTLLPMLFLACLLLGHVSHAEAPIVAVEDLIPSKKHAHTNALIAHIISTYHYRKIPIDDHLSETILGGYLKRLDPNRLYFLQSDIEQFDLYYKSTLDDAIKDSDIVPAFTIFKTFRQRVVERSQHATQLLAQQFDFSRDEEYLFDRQEVSWAKNQQELDQIWRQRVKNDLLSLQLADNEKSASEIIDVLQKRYQRLRINTQQLNANDVFQLFINAYTSAIEPHTSYFSPRVSENFDISMRLSLQGIGAVLRNDSDYTRVVKIIPGGPADLSGLLQAEDRIIGVGQGESGVISDIIGWRLDDVVDLIRGPKGSMLQLKILPHSMGTEAISQIISLQRDEVKLEDQAAKSALIKIPETGHKIGVIDLPVFYVDFAGQSRGESNYRSTHLDVQRLIDELNRENIDGLIVDLRGNGGGALSEALKFTGLFIKDGPVVQTKDAAGRIKVGYDTDSAVFYVGPLAVLVDRGSASASEIFAGAIQDYRRGIILGEPTFGKGTVQKIIDLDGLAKDAEKNHGQLKITTAQFFRVSGESNQYTGVIPDIIFPAAQTNSEQGERAYANAIPWDSISQVRYMQASAPVDAFDKVRQQHSQRIQRDKLFQLYLAGMRLQEKNSDKQTISLVQEKRFADREKLLQDKKLIDSKIREVRGLPPSDELDQSEPADPLLDIVLNEAAKILSDLIIAVPEGTTQTQISQASDGLAWSASH